ARLAPLDGVTFVAAPQGTTSNYWLNTILLADPAQRSPLLTLAHEQGLGLRPAWTPLHQLPMYLTAPKAHLSRTEDLAARIVNLPSSPGLPAI
ncbi:MAG TPA: aminotransferase DegT, partial [Desulfobacterales bacterium]|nr:aminotransferase DegT [Desulfobacterales bacterium]